VVEAAEDSYLLVDRNDTLAVVVAEQTNVNRAHWDRALNRMDYNRVNRMMMMMQLREHLAVEPNLNLVVVEDSMDLNDDVDA